ncbi:MAG: hypothetical protein ACRD29_24010 [Acidimicrobiales bacterium]
MPAYPPPLAPRPRRSPWRDPLALTVAVIVVGLAVEVSARGPTG